MRNCSNLVAMMMIKRIVKWSILCFDAPKNCSWLFCSANERIDLKLRSVSKCRVSKYGKSSLNDLSRLNYKRKFLKGAFINLVVLNTLPIIYLSLTETLWITFHGQIHTLVINFVMSITQKYGKIIRASRTKKFSGFSVFIKLMIC